MGERAELLEGLVIAALEAGAAIWRVGQHVEHGGNSGQR